MQKFTTFLGSLLAIAFLVGLAFTLTRSSMIGFFDVLPVYILMGIAIFMMVYEAFFDKKCFLYKIHFVQSNKSNKCEAPKGDIKIDLR